MNFTYEFPDITGYIQKSGTYKKPRRISGLRLGESRTAVEKRFPLSLSRRDEDKHIDYFTVSMKEKISLFAAVHAAERAEVDPLQLQDTDYRDLLYAVNVGKYVVDTGNYYINVGSPVNREEFLSLSGYHDQEDGTRIFDWDFEGFPNAKLFTQEEIETIVPEPYRNPMYLIMENIAKERYGGIEL